MAEDDTTTVEQTADTGAEALPVEAPEQTADSSETEVSSQSNEGAEETALPTENDELVNFAKGQGIEDVSELSEREKKILKMARDSQAQFTQKRQKATELEKTMGEMSDESATQVAAATGQDPEVLKRVQKMEVNGAIRDFFDDNPQAKQYQAEMGQIAIDSGLYGSPEAILKASYAIAVANNSGSLKSQGKREALTSLAQKQQAAVPRGNATTPNATPKQKPFEEMSIKEMEAKLGVAKR